MKFVFFLCALALSTSAFSADTDRDGVEDAYDNCSMVSNASQIDSDNDGIGNGCDGDLNNDGIVNTQDSTLFRQQLGASNQQLSASRQQSAASRLSSSGHSAADFNGNGHVNAQDAILLRRMLGKPPGPAGGISTSQFPVRTEPGKRYLVDAQGNPFFLQGDTAWILTVQLNLADAEIYMEDRRQRGVNALVVELIENTWGDNAPENYYGEAPFTGANFATPNPAYFDRVAQLLDIAAAKGQILLLSPAYMGYQGHIEGWYPQMVAAGATVLRNYGRFLGQRFAAYDNIMWVHGGDWDPPQAGVTLGTALADGIKEFDPQGKWLHTVHADRNTSALDSPLHRTATVDATYTSDTTVVAENHAAWFDSGLPYFLYESYYEDGEEGDFIRKMAYQSLLAGASGHVTGNNRVWKGQPGWKNHLDTEGSRSLPHIKSLFTSREWWLLVPDTDATFLTGGVNPGTHQAPAALASDRSFGLIYVQEYRQLTVNMSRLAGPKVTARWFDSANGTYQTISGSPFNASGSRQFSPPGNNSQGHTDWVLVLESSP